MQQRKAFQGKVGNRQQTVGKNSNSNLDPARAGQKNKIQNKERANE
jgi:hypothetical protein